MVFVAILNGRLVISLMGLGYQAMRCVFGSERQKDILCPADTLVGWCVGQVLHRYRPSCWCAAPLFSLACHLLLISTP